MVNKYYPGRNNPLHEVKDWCKVRSMIRALRRGDELPTVYVDGNGDGRDGNWLSGTHRVAASEIRALLDNTEPYADLDICDVSGWLAALADDARDAFVSMLDGRSEDACDILDACSNRASFVAEMAKHVEA